MSRVPCQDRGSRWQRGLQGWPGAGEPAPLYACNSFQCLSWWDRGIYGGWRITSDLVLRLVRNQKIGIEPPDMGISWKIQLIYDSYKWLVIGAAIDQLDHPLKISGLVMLFGKIAGIKGMENDDRQLIHMMCVNETGVWWKVTSLGWPFQYIVVRQMVNHQVFGCPIFKQIHISQLDKGQTYCKQV